MSQPDLRAGPSERGFDNMVRTNLRFRAIPSLVVAVMITFGVLAPGIRAAGANQEGTTNGAGQENRPQPGIDCVDRLDFGELFVDAVAEVEFGVHFKGVKDPG